ncbi:hypothetical protein [Rivularia sp. UHCC 0363]|uniref:hypothetical protein n=1 Tax=Rivularia sp. UHCC 0363 TaxID=3110244 RepID=UPI002B21CC27|nr:hypothetical protein [Rivularia sp. UHCC 0363]MEA5596219.1 hypothetical protein [Rivularia sp. UHCC 0363]
MNLKRAILFLLLVVPGSAAVIASTWWGINDFSALEKANRNFDKLVSEGADQKELFIASHKENTHRINVGFDGTWVALGGILISMGILGIAQTQNK